MALDLIPAALQARYRFAERDHACAILARDFPSEFSDLMDCLTAFKCQWALKTSQSWALENQPF
jgi:hypothetical protein